MKFTTPCFVRVEDAEKRKKLIDFCKNCGYTAIYSIDPTYEFVVCGLVANNVDVASSYDSDTMRNGLVCYGLIDCGDNIELFKALAAMNDVNDKEQWYSYADYPTPECKNGIRKMILNHSVTFDSWQDGICGYTGYYRKATAQEIIEHFNKKRK